MTICYYLALSILTYTALSLYARAPTIIAIFVYIFSCLLLFIIYFSLHLGDYDLQSIKYIILVLEELYKYSFFLLLARRNYAFLCIAALACAELAVTKSLTYNYMLPEVKWYVDSNIVFITLINYSTLMMHIITGCIFYIMSTTKYRLISATGINIMVHIAYNESRSIYVALPDNISAWVAISESAILFIVALALLVIIGRKFQIQRNELR